MRADIHDGPEHKPLQSETGYIDARPQSRQIDETSCDARPDHTFGSFATDRCAMKIGPCPQCPESDGWPSMALARAGGGRTSTAGTFGCVIKALQSRNLHGWLKLAITPIPSA